ncbi:hypothetical protein SLI_1918 [Streptomyces lividans 1326]|uniref:Uncharacterized protein n=1 Tax=Streptomyces lividans 1326 TaxID=1200984 RepID=A0A7U9H9N8_STRLI|nr:hypothetical protein SLI_1918 [Streptomyces lividans 1326]
MVPVRARPGGVGAVLSSGPRCRPIRRSRCRWWVRGGALPTWAWARRRGRSRPDRGCRGPRPGGLRRRRGPSVHVPPVKLVDGRWRPGRGVCGVR